MLRITLTLKSYPKQQEGSAQGSNLGVWYVRISVHPTSESGGQILQAPPLACTRVHHISYSVLRIYMTKTVCKTYFGGKEWSFVAALSLSRFLLLSFTPAHGGIPPFLLEHLNNREGPQRKGPRGAWQIRPWTCLQSANRNRPRLWFTKGRVLHLRTTYLVPVSTSDADHV